MATKIAEALTKGDRIQSFAFHEKNPVNVTVVSVEVFAPEMPDNVAIWCVNEAGQTASIPAQYGQEFEVPGW
jgi:hypothetical protein